MKIIHLISGNLGQGGAERLVLDLAAEQANLGHDVSICCFRKTSPTLPRIQENVHLISLEKKPGLSPFFSFKLFGFLKKEHPDIVNCHLPAVFPYLVFSLLFLKDIAFCYTIHNTPVFEEGRKIIRDIRRFFINRNRLHIIAISDFIKSDFAKLYDTQNVQTIYNGRNNISKTTDFDKVRKEINSYKKDSDTKVFIAVGRLMEQKNYPLLLNSFAELKNRNIICIILGGGDARQFLDITPENVFFLGPKSNVGDYLLCSDAFCMSSSWEGFPIAIIEAMSAGLPILATAVGGIPDAVVDGKNGFLCTEISNGSFSEIIKKYLSLQDSEREFISKNNINEFLKNYDIHFTAKQYIDLYERIKK